MGYFNKLNINQKLWLYLIIPGFALVFFASSFFYEQHKTLTTNRQVSQSFEISQAYANLLHSLQLERGLSAGVLSKREKGYYQAQIKVQRQKTDLNANQVSSLLLDKEKLPLNQQQHAAVLQSLLQQLDLIRTQVDSGNRQQYYGFYTQLNAQLLNASLALFSDGNFSRYGSLATTYLNLLWLGEYAGQERSLTIDFYTRDYFNATDYANLSTILAGQQSILDNIQKMAPQQYRAGLEALKQHRDQQTIDYYRQLFAYQVKKNDLLNSIYELTGMGGMIHNFKNYLLRGEMLYAENAKHKASLAKQRILNFIDENERFIQSDNSLQTIFSAISLYEGKIDLITHMRSINQSIDDIDKAVKINDEPFYRALNWFNFDVSVFASRQWWQASTGRIDSIRALNQRIAGHLKNDLNADKVLVWQHFWQLFIAAVLLLVFTLWIGFQVKNRMVTEIKGLSEFMRASQRGKTLPRAKVTGNDEISLMQNAFYALLDQRDAHERELKLSSKVFYHAHEGICLTDKDGLVIDINPAFSEITGYARHEVLGQSLSLLKSGRHEQAFYKQMWDSLLAQGYWKGDISNKTKSGAIIEESLTISALKNADQQTTHYIAMFIDVTERKQKLQHFREMAFYDQLTTLPNRSLLRERFSLAKAYCDRQQGRMAVCYIDLNKFKPVNDVYGHDVGDLVLVEFARRLKQSIREQDTAARIGGDEFVLLLCDNNSQQADFEQVINRVSEAVFTPYQINQFDIEIGASIGIAFYPDHSADFEELLTLADKRMFKAKANGLSFSQYLSESN